MPSKTLVTFLAKITFMPKALTYKNAITLLLFKNWLVCVCVCVYSPNGFKCLVHFLHSSSFVLIPRFYHYHFKLSTTFLIIHLKEKTMKREPPLGSSLFKTNITIVRKAPSSYYWQPKVH